MYLWVRFYVHVCVYEFMYIEPTQVQYTGALECYLTITTSHSF